MKKRFPVPIVVLIAVIIIDQLYVSWRLLEYSNTDGISGIVAASVLAVALIVVSLIYAHNSTRHFSRMNAHLEASAAEYMNTLPAPIAVIDKNKKFVWYNSTFTEKISRGMDVFGLSFEEYVKLDVDSLIADGSAICRINGQVFRAVSEEFIKGDIAFLIIYFHDETDYFNLRKEADESHPSVVIMTIDTYDEIMQNAKESEKAQASVEIEQLVERFMSSTNGLIKKTSPNTFYAVLEKRHLDEKIRDKFKILDLARNIKISGKYPLTFSIGVGLGATSLEASEKLARQCLDMALGRGGDQAVIKIDGGYRFFGGVSKGVEKMSRTKTRIIANAMQDVIMNSDKVFIMGHRFGDLDSVGASCGLAGALKLMGKEVYIAVDRSKSLAPNLIENVEKQIDGNLFITTGAALAAIDANDLLIVVDIHSKDFLESRELYEKARQVVVIDHHRKTVNYIDDAVISHMEPTASSASEMVTELIQYFRFKDEDAIPACCAEALLAGIMLDTKNFIMRTGARTFEAAAFLKKLGADTVAVKLLFSNSFDSYKRKTQIVASAKIHNNCAIATADFKSDDIRIVAPQAADELLNITNVGASFVIFKTGNVVNISARSLGAVNVQVIMELLGGGGHQSMAAVQLEDKTVQEAMKMLISAIDKRQKETQDEE